jgi:hypothetical protein
LKVDKVTVRMILNTDRAMEFIHIKDMRAAGFEPRMFYPDTNGKII